MSFQEPSRQSSAAVLGQQMYSAQPTPEGSRRAPIRVPGSRPQTMQSLQQSSHMGSQASVGFGRPQSTGNLRDEMMRAPQYSVRF